MEDTWYMKSPCKHCPYRRDVKPFLHPARGEELAYHAQNPYNSFTCHKTMEHDDEGDDMINTDDSLICAGFLALQIFENGDEYKPEGFEPDEEKVYGDVYEMIDAYNPDGEMFDDEDDE